MKLKKMSGNKCRYLFSILLISLSVLVIVVCTLYIVNLKKTVNFESKRYLQEISEQVVAFVNYRIEVCKENLESIGNTYQKFLIKDGDMEFLKSKADRNGYLWIGYIDLDGVNHMTNGQVIDMSNEPYIKRVLNGEEVTACIITPYQENKKSILYAVPLYDEEKICGALSSCNESDFLRELCDANIFGGEGFTYIIDCDGNFVVDSKNKNACDKYENFFEMMEKEGRLDSGYSIEDMKEDMKNNETGMLYYTLSNGVHKAMTYASLENDDWYLLSVVPTKATGANTSTFIKFTIAINVLIIFLFAVLIIIIMILEKRNRKYLEKVAFVDPITGGYSKAKFEQEAERLIKRSKPFVYAFVSLDIQKFKLINETFGSEAGNKTLTHVHNVIKDNLYSDECVARITADTFNILMKNDGREVIINRLDNIAESINAYNNNLEHKYFLTIYEGVYIIDDTDFNMIIIQDRANVARKNNKDIYINSTNSCVFYTDVEREKLVKEKELDNCKETALQNHEFVVYLQPKINLSNNKIEGAEALVRWNNKEKGIISPGEFIPAFEKNGFIIKLDLYVFEEVCKMIKKWIENNISPIPISVNLSKVHFSNNNFVNKFKEIFEKYNIPSELIEIEFTETLVFENVEMLTDTIGKFHEIGFKCSLDDFGSGYSSLNILKDVPVDILKLDGAFFRGKNEGSKRGEYVVESVIDIAKKLDMRTVSEGVESYSQVEFLKNAKCDMVQGYVFYKPMPIVEFEKIAF